MEISHWAILQTNITLVYDAVNLEDIDRNALRRQIVPETPPVVTEIPGEMIALVYPTMQVACILGDRRVRVNDGSQQTIGNRPLAAITLATAGLIDRQRLLAYGFNYDILLTLSGVDDSGRLLTENFLLEPSQLAHRLNAQLHATSLRLNYARQGTRYELALEPDQAGRIKAHLNVHFEGPECLPNADTLQASFQSEFDGLIATLRNL